MTNRTVLLENLISMEYNKRTSNNGCCEKSTCKNSSGSKTENFVEAFDSFHDRITIMKEEEQKLCELEYHANGPEHFGVASQCVRKSPGYVYTEDNRKTKMMVGALGLAMFVVITYSLISTSSLPFYDGWYGTRGRNGTWIFQFPMRRKCAIIFLDAKFFNQNKDLCGFFIVLN